MERTIYFNYLASQDLIEPAADGRVDNIGKDRMGCTALLDWLEGQLGIASFEPEQRLFAFYQLLNEHITPEHRIYDSFNKNSMATSRVVMSWFDALTLIGWRGERFEDGRLERFSFLSDIYSRAWGSIAAQSTALRIKQCLLHLDNNFVQLNKIVLAQPKTLMPLIWQGLFDKLEHSGIDVIDSISTENSKSEADVLLIPASGVIDAASITAQYLSMHSGSSGDALLVTSDGCIVDQALAGFSMPSAGFKETSDSRLVTQVLPAILNTLSGDFSIENMVALLTHPLWIGDYVLSKKLAKKLVASLGIGNSEWEELEGELVNQNPELIDWLTAIKSNEANLFQFAKAIEAIRAKALKRQDSIYSEFARQCKIILEVLDKSSDVTTLNHLSKILRELGVGQLQMQETIAQVAEFDVCHGLLQPGHVSIKPEKTLWVGPYFNGQYTLPDWYQSEVDALTERYDVFSRHDDLAIQRNSWNHFLKQTQHNLVIIDFDSETITHPIFDELCAVNKVKVKHWADYLLDIDSERVEKRYDTNPLIFYKKVADINQPVPTSSEMSASRLEQLIFKPSEFVLSHCAMLRDNSIELPVADNRSKGIYAHALFEAYFNANPIVDNWSDVDTWEQEHYWELFKQHALVYLEPGASFEMQSIREQSTRALKQLIQTFKLSGVVRVTSELSVNELPINIAAKRFIAKGSIDLLLEKQDGSVMVLDAKWTNSSSKKHTKALEKGFAIQLYTYAAIYHQKYNIWPHVGYFIIKEGEFLIDDRNFISGDDVTPLKFAFDNVAAAWHVTKELASWRLDQLDQGKIELNNPGCEPVDQVSYPEDAELKKIIVEYWKVNSKKDPDYFGDRFSDYRHLLGWRKNDKNKSA